MALQYANSRGVLRAMGGSKQAIRFIKRAIGGLGILLVNQLADSVTYEYKNGYNILTILKKTEE